jgi:uncharacterized sulfatase
MIVRWPGHLEQEDVSEDMVTTLDITKTILDLSGAASDVELHGMNLLDGNTDKREYIFAARDKMDSTHDAMRAIRSAKYKLIHNLMPERPYLQYNKYKELNYPVLAQLNVMKMRGELNEEQSHFMAEEKPEFELFDMVDDPYELNNLAKDPDYAEIKNDLLSVLNSWREKIKDPGVTDEFRQGGWSSDYPTRNLEEWEEMLKVYKGWVFREPDSKQKHPRQTVWKK